MVQTMAQIRQEDINMSTKYTQLVKAFANCLEIKVFPHAGGDVTKIKCFILYVPPSCPPAYLFRIIVKIIAYF